MKLRNIDYKSLSQLISLGGQGKDLTNDTKILCYASDEKRLLSDAIEAGDISDDVLLGFAVKHRSVFNLDSQMQNLNLIDFEIISDGIIFTLPYFVSSESFIRLLVDGVQLLEKITDLPQNNYYELLSENTIKVHFQDVFSQIDIVVLNGVESEHQINKFNARNSILFSKQFLVSDMSQDLTNYFYQLPETFSTSDMLIVSVNGRIWNFKNTQKKYSIIYPNIVSFKKTDLSLTDNIYVLCIKSDSIVDNNGNIILQDSIVTDYVIEGIGINYKLSVSDSGEIIADETNDSVDLVYVKNEYNNAFKLSVDSNKQINSDSTTLSFVSTIILKSNSGIHYKLNVTNNGELFTELYDVVDNRISVGDVVGKTTYALKLKNSFVSDYENNKDDTIRLFISEEFGEKRLIKKINNEYKIDLIFSESAIGTVVDSDLEPEEFQALNGTSWKPLNGEISLNVVDYPDLALLVPDWVNENVIELPNATEKQFFIRSKVGDYLDTNLTISPPPTGFKYLAHIYTLDWTGADITNGGYPAGIDSFGHNGTINCVRARGDEVVSNFAIYERDIKLLKYIKVI